MSVEQLLTEVQRLPEEQQINLIDRLLAGMHGPADPVAEAAWDEEMAQRRQRLKEGKTTFFPWSEVRDAARR